MKRLSREFKIGLFGLGMVILLYLGINFIKSQDIFSRNRTFYAIYDNSDGLEASSPVVIKGYRVGTVDEVRYDMPTRRVIVEISVKRDYPLPLDSEAKITSTSLLGNKVIELRLGNSLTNMESGDTIRSVIEPGLLELASGEYEQLKEKATSLVEQLSQALTGVNQVLSKQNVDNITGLLTNLNSASQNVDQLVANEVTMTLQELQTLASVLRQTGPQINNVVDKISLTADSLSITVPALLTNAANAVDELNTALAAINNQDGTVGKLIHDKALYTHLSNASASLTLLLQDFRHNPGRYVHFSVFGGGTKNKDRSSKAKSKDNQ